jgi:hypothetical protein
MNFLLPIYIWPISRLLTYGASMQVAEEEEEKDEKLRGANQQAADTRQTVAVGSMSTMSLRGETTGSRN